MGLVQDTISKGLLKNLSDRAAEGTKGIMQRSWNTATFLVRVGEWGREATHNSPARLKTTGLVDSIPGANL